MNYSTNFVKKALTLSDKLCPDIKSKEKRLSLISGEKISTVKNWLFHNKSPVASKRLMLSDKFGVSEDYLFGDYQHPEIPVAVYNNELTCYLIPQIDEGNLNNLISASTPLVLQDRQPLKLELLLNNEVKSPYLTYCFEAIHLTFPPFISTHDIVFVNSTALYKNNTFCLYKTTTGIELVKIDTSEGASRVYTKQGTCVAVEGNALIIPVLLILSRNN
ncbi:hypothetical protein [Cedecea sp. NFIX57]|uniref:hypothetical protein n=1 Tax=Cedecea sp. NFIX57 TaxID=1566286 RepID=UPI000A0B5700|nr:hypothetical protein [Cedecea sp. NFIX57]SMG59152.1 hypothetical protein SAMN03159353_10295 [Cedecea sp. NFIX57]